MSNIEGIHPAGAPKPIEGVGSVAQTPGAKPPVSISDTVEISDVARLAARIQDLPPVRTELVERVKAEVAAGAYETPERLEVAIDRLMEDLFPGA